MRNEKNYKLCARMRLYFLAMLLAGLSQPGAYAKGTVDNDYTYSQQEPLETINQGGDESLTGDNADHSSWEADSEVVLRSEPPGYIGPGIGIAPASESSGVMIFIMIMLSLYSGLVWLRRDKKLKLSDYQSKFMKKIVLALLLILPISAFADITQVTVNKNNGVCHQDCKITATVTGAKTGQRGYALWDVTNNQMKIAYQASEDPSVTYDNLPAGIYQVYVYEDGTTPYPYKTENIEVITTYVDFTITGVAPSSTTSVCGETGKLTTSVSGGKSPFNYELIQVSGTPYTGTTTNATGIFTDLPTGDYRVKITDACGNSKTSNVSTVTSTYVPLPAVDHITAVGTVKVDGNGNCSRLEFTSMPVDIYNTASTKFSTTDAAKFTIRYRYPATAAPMSVPVFTNFDPVTNGTSIRVEVIHPCSGVITTYDYDVSSLLVEDYSAVSLGVQTGTGFCSVSNTLNFTNFSSRNCYPINVKVYKTSDLGTLVTERDVTTQTSRSISVTGLSLEPSTNYTIVITGPLGTPVTRTATTSNFTLNNVAFSYTSNRPSIYCPVATSNLYTTTFSGSEVTYTIIAAPAEAPSHVGRTKTITGTGSLALLWDDLALGIYAIEVDYGCRKQNQNVTLPNATVSSIAFTKTYNNATTPCCDATAAILSISGSITSSVPVTCKIIAAPAEAPSHVGRMKTLTGAGFRADVLNDLPFTEMKNKQVAAVGGIVIWDDLAFGTYTIEVDYGCRKENVDVVFTKPVPASRLSRIFLHIRSNTSYCEYTPENSTVYVSVNQPPTPAEAAGNVITIISGPAGTVGRSGNDMNASGGITGLDNLPYGEYVVEISYHGGCRKEQKTLTVPVETNSNTPPLTAVSFLNTQTCKWTSGIQVYQYKNSTVRYTITAGPAGTIGRTETISKIVPSSTYDTIFKDLPAATGYKIKMEFLSCGSRADEVSSSITISIPTPSTAVTPTYQLGSCPGVYTITWKFFSTGATELATAVYNTTTSELYKIVGGNRQLVKTISSSTAANRTIANLPPGDYILRGFSSTDISAGATCPTYPEQRFTLSGDEFNIRVDYAKSGGVTCSGDLTGDLYIEATNAARYRCKPLGAPDSGYSLWQTSKTFTGLTVGQYTVQIEGTANTCSSILNVNLWLYNGNTQFLNITQPLNSNGNICTGERAVLRALPIGPVTNYRWTRNGTALPAWNDKDSLVIPSMGAGDVGNYVLTVNNASGCLISSNRSLTVSSPPTLPTIDFNSNTSGCVTELPDLKLKFNFGQSGTWNFYVNETAYSTTDVPYYHPLTLKYGNNTFVISAISLNGGCASSTVITKSVAFTPPAATWTAEGAQSVWNDEKNWDPAIPGTCTYVTIPAGKSHYPDLTAEDHAVCDIIDFSFGGEVAKTALLTYNKAKVAMNVSKDRWYTISAPLRDMYSGDYFSDLSFLPSNPLKRQNPTIYMMHYQMANPQTGYMPGNGAWSNPFSTTEESLNVGLGYSVWVHAGTRAESNFNLTFPKDSTYYYSYYKNGAVERKGSTVSRTNSSRFIYETGDVPTSVASADGSFSVGVPGDKIGNTNILVGNPFMSHLDFAAFQQANSGVITNSYQIFGGTSFESVLSSGSVTLSTTGDVRYIAPMQSIIVPKSNASSKVNSLNFTLGMSVTRPGTTLRSSVGQPNVLNLELSRGANRQSGMLFHYVDGVSNTYNVDKDVLTFFNEADFADDATTGPAILYSVLDNKPASIRTVGDLSNPFELGVRTVEKGKLTLKALNVANLDENLSLILEDRLTNKKIDLRVTPEYEFSNQVGNIEKRFYLNILRSSNEVTGLDDLKESSGIKIYYSKEILHVSSVSKPIESIEIFNSLGQCIYNMHSLKVNTYDLHLKPQGQILIVKVTTSNAQKIEKVLVK